MVQSSSLMSDRLRRWSPALVIVGLLLSWELLHYLEWIDSGRFSHPLGILPILGDRKFLRDFGVMLVQLAFASVVGGVAGAALGSLLLFSSWLTQAARRFLRVGLWLPFIFYWPLPIWPPGERDWFLPTVFVWLLTAGAVTLSTCYHFLSGRSTPGLEHHTTRGHVRNATILHALFITLISQLWLSSDTESYGWDWLAVPMWVGVTGAYGVLTFLVVLLFLLDRVFQFSFDRTAEVRGTLLTREVADRNWSSLGGAVLLSLLCLILWYLVSRWGFYPVVGSPVKTFTQLPSLFRSTLVLSPLLEGTIWRHLGVSLLEVCGGLIAAGGAASLVVRGMSMNSTFKTWMNLLLPLTYVAPMVLPLFVIYWFQLAGVWQSTAGVAFLSFFPFVQVLWGLRDRPPLFRVLIAAAEALPFAFVAMIVGETLNAVAGLGFLILVAHTLSQTATALAVALLTFAVLTGLSSTLLWIAKRCSPSVGRWSEA